LSINETLRAISDHFYTFQTKLDTDYYRFAAAAAAAAILYIAIDALLTIQDSIEK